MGSSKKMGGRGSCRATGDAATRRRGASSSQHSNPRLGAALSTQHGSVTSSQIKRLHQLAIPKGFTHEDLRALAEVESLKDLSSAQASDLIRQLGGGELKHAPGQAPPPSRERGRSRGTIRLITEAQLEQIERLGAEYFSAGQNPPRQVGGHAQHSALSTQHFRDWLSRDFKVATIRDLATAERGGQVIAVLKGMLARRERKPSTTSIPSIAQGVRPS
jgi:hypothetical protein